MTDLHDIRFEVSPALLIDDLQELFSVSWPPGEEKDYRKVLHYSLLYVGAFAGHRLVGFVSVAWDGGVHAFLLDTTVHPDFRRRGIGSQLVVVAAEATKARGVEWLHVDYDA